MATITLKQGDFGSDVTVVVGEAALYLPDRKRPGLNELVPLAEIAEIELLSQGHAGQLKQAARLGARGFLAAGNPLGLAAGVFAVTKVKDVEFAVRLKDGRRFVATASALTLAALRAGSRTPARPTGEDAEAAARADAVIAKYLAPGALPAEPQPAPASKANAAPAAAPAATAAPAPAADDPAAAPATDRPVFGRRGLRQAR